MRVLYLAVLTIFLLSASTHALAEFDGNELLRGCNSVIKQENGDKLSTTELVLAAHCTGYVSGFIDSHTIDSYAFEKYTQKKLLYCLPESKINQFVRVIVKYLRDHPAKLHNDARMLVLDALFEAFPCKE
ncbi:MAG: Rap1a/Tai family immunity protein [Bacteroidota bacterium]|jgi:hypothetical protein